MATAQIPINPLSAAFRGFLSGQQAVQKREQDAIENELTQQLRQIQLINAQRALSEASKTPQQRLAEQIQEAFTLDALKRGALVQAPVGLEGESIALPSAIGQTAAELEAASTFAPSVQATPLSITTGQPELPSLSDALSQIVIPEVQQTPSFNIPTAANRGFEEPSPIPGFNVSEEAARQKTAQDISKAVQLAQAKVAATPPGYRIMTDALGNVSYIPTTPGRGEVQAVTTPEGEQFKARVPSAGGGRDLTPNQKNAVLARAGTAGITREEIESKYTKNGVIDYDQITLDSNKFIATDKKLAAEEKAKQIPAGDRSKAAGFIAAYDDLNKLTDLALKLKSEGKEPGVWDRAVSTALQQPPDGVFSALYQSAIGQDLTADVRQLDALKARVRGAVTRANAGLSQTQAEIANLTQYVPIPNDTLEKTLEKAAGLQEYLRSQVSSLTVDPKEWLASLDQGATVRAPTPSTAQTAPIQIKSIRRKQ